MSPQGRMLIMNSGEKVRGLFLSLLFFPRCPVVRGTGGWGEGVCVWGGTEKGIGIEVGKSGS